MFKIFSQNNKEKDVRCVYLDKTLNCLQSELRY